MTVFEMEKCAKGLQGTLHAGRPVWRPFSIWCTVYKAECCNNCAIKSYEVINVKQIGVDKAGPKHLQRAELQLILWISTTWLPTKSA